MFSLWCPWGPLSFLVIDCGPFELENDSISWPSNEDKCVINDLANDLRQAPRRNQEAIWSYNLHTMKSTKHFVQFFMCTGWHVQNGKRFKICYYSKTCYSTNFFRTKLDFTLFWIGSIITSTALFFEILLTFYSTILTWFMIERKMSNFFFVVFFSSLINISVV